MQHADAKARFCVGSYCLLSAKQRTCHAITTRISAGVWIHALHHLPAAMHAIAHNTRNRCCIHSQQIIVCTSSLRRLNQQSCPPFFPSFAASANLWNCAIDSWSSTHSFTVSTAVVQFHHGYILAGVGFLLSLSRACRAHESQWREQSILRRSLRSSLVRP